MSKQLPAKMVRVEYEVPPVRWIRSVWYEDLPDATDEDYAELVWKDHPKAKIRKVHRGISPDQARAIAFHDE